jgi:hypothetical protein
MKTITLSFIFLFATLCHAGLLYQYHELTLMSLDQMNKIVRDKLKESKHADAKTVPLKEGIQAVFSRPDQDRMIEKVIAPLRSELQDMDQYDRTMTALTEEALNALTNTRNFKPSVQVTYAVFLENLMADSRKAAEEDGSLEQKLLQKIKKANIKVTKEAENERRVRGGLPDSKSPSEIAASILEEIDKAKKERAEAEKAEKEKKPEQVPEEKK